MFNDLVNKSMKDKVAALKSKRNNSTDEDNANSEHSYWWGSTDCQEEKGTVLELNKLLGICWLFACGAGRWSWADGRTAQEEVQRVSLVPNMLPIHSLFCRFFTLCLQCDMKKYSTTKQNIGVSAVNHVTFKLHHIIHEQLRWWLCSHLPFSAPTTLKLNIH